MFKRFLGVARNDSKTEWLLAVGLFLLAAMVAILSRQFAGGSGNLESLFY